MYSYIKGIVMELMKDHIVLDHNGMGYLIYVSNPYEYQIGSELTVYVYHHVFDGGIALFGFKTKQARDLFLKLILVKGIGPKTANGMLASGDYDAIMQAIESGNVAYLKKIPGIGPKAAQQIILDLQGKITGNKDVNMTSNLQLEEACEVLLALGYKKSEIDHAMKQLVEQTLDTNGYVKKALSILVK